MHGGGIIEPDRDDAALAFLMFDDNFGTEDEQKYEDEQQRTEDAHRGLLPAGGGLAAVGPVAEGGEGRRTMGNDPGAP